MATFLRMAGGGLVNADVLEQIEVQELSATDRKVFAIYKDGGRAELAQTMDELTALLCPRPPYGETDWGLVRK